MPPARPRRNWRRIRRWIAAITLIMVIIGAGALAGLVFIFHNNSFRQYVLRAANARISDALGAEVHIRDFSLRLSRVTPTLELYDVVVNGASPYQDPPLLQISRVAIGARIISIFHRKWYLADLVIDHPVLRLVVDANENTNLPKGSRSIKGIFGVGIRRVTLRQGEIYFNDRKNVLDASLRDVELQSSFDADYFGHDNSEQSRRHSEFDGEWLGWKLVRARNHRAIDSDRKQH